MSEFQTRYGPWALVAGASEGLGAEFATQLAARGLNLALVARRADALEALRVEIESKHRIQVRTLPFDLASPESPEKVVAALADVELGLVVYNAAFAPSGAFHELSLEDNLRSIDVNVRAPLTLAHALGRKMIPRGRGGLVFLSSLTAFQGSPFLTTYGATKAFNLTLAEGLWFELANHGVDVLAVCAGATRTPNMVRAMPQGAPGMLEPSAVVADALDRLGKTPLTIAGAFNQFASFLMRRLMPRRTTISIMGSQTRRLPAGH